MVSNPESATLSNARNETQQQQQQHRNASSLRKQLMV